MASVNIPSSLQATPANSAVATTSNYVSSTDLIASGDTSAAFDKRDVDEQLVKRYGNQGVTGLMELLGNKKETTNRLFEHYEETFLHNQFAGAITGGTGTLTVDQVDTDGGDSSGANKQSAVRDGDLLLGASGNMYYVTKDSASPDEITLKNVSDGALA